MTEADVQVRDPWWIHRDFALLWTGQTVSQAGSAVTTVALPLVAVVALRASAFGVGLLTALTYTAFLLVTLPAGAIVQRLAKRKVMIWSDVARLVIIGSVPLAGAFGVLTLAQLYVVALAAGIFTVFFDISYQSYVPSLVAPKYLLAANSRLGASESFGLLAGRALGSGLVAVAGAAGAMAADALSYLISAASLAVIKQRESRPRHSVINRPKLRAEIADGLVFIWRHKVLREIVACAAVGNFFFAIEMALTVIFLIRLVHVTPAVAAVLISVGSAAGMAGSLLSGRLAGWIGSARVLWVSLLVFGLPSLMMPLAAPGWRVALFPVGYAGCSFSSSVFGVAQLTYRQSVCPADLLAKMNAACRWLLWGVLPLGGLLGGLSGSILGVRTSLWVAVSGFWAAGFLVFFSPLRHVRDLEAVQAG